MQRCRALYVFLVSFSGWAACAYAIPPTEPEAPVTLASNTAAKNTAKTGAKTAKGAAKPASLPAAAASKPPLSASQKLEQHDILAQPSADFVCPRATKAGATECFLNAVEHLYTVCRQVKAIELLEFGFAKAEEGPNGFKSEFCRRKQKASMPSYFDAALREVRAMSSCEAARTLNDLYAVWDTTMAGLRQHPNETEAEYKERIAVPYLAFAAYRQQVRDALASAGQRPVQNCPTLATFKP